MHHRAGSTRRAAAARGAAREPRSLARVVYVLDDLGGVVGTLVTAAGPHGGDVQARRLGMAARRRRARARHLGRRARRARRSSSSSCSCARRRAAARRSTSRRSRSLVMAAQGVLGYVQYFDRIPAVLVGFHVFGAVCVFTCVQQLVLELSRRRRSARRSRRATARADARTSRSRGSRRRRRSWREARRSCRGRTRGCGRAARACTSSSRGVQERTRVSAREPVPQLVADARRSGGTG